MDNNALFFLIFNLSHKSAILDDFMVFSTNYLIYLSLLGIFLIAFKGNIKERKALLLILFSLPLAILLIKVIHIFINEPRPFVTFNFTPLADNRMDLSFPSRHATIMAVIAFAYTYFKSKWSILFLALTALVGVSRIYVGVHYPIDVLGGFLLGIIAIAATLQIKNILKISFFR